MRQTWRLTGAPPREVIEELAHLLRSDGVALLPADTIYGLHALATSETAIQRIVEAKGRESDKPFVVLGASTDQLRNAGVCFPAGTLGVLEQLWPGPLTAVLPLTGPIAASRGLSTLAVRVPDLPWLRELVAMTGPLASTSANLAGAPPLCSPAELSDRLNVVDATLDLGRREGKPSVIVDLTGAEPRFIREGESFFTQKVWKTLRKSL